MKLETLMKILSGDPVLSKRYTQEQIEQQLNLHRRLLSKEESIVWHDRLKQKWDVNGYWYPLKSNPPVNLSILCLQDSAFNPYKSKLRDELIRNKLNHITHCVI